MSALMEQAVAEKTKVSAKILIDDLLSAYYALRTDRWEDWESIEAAIKTSQEVNPTDYNGDEVISITELLGRIVPLYKGAKERCEKNPKFRELVGNSVLLRDYRKHMKALEAAAEGITHRMLDPEHVEKYASAVGAAKLFLYTSGDRLPQDKRIELRLKIGSVRSELPGRFDYGRNI